VKEAMKITVSVIKADVGFFNGVSVTPNFDTNSEESYFFIIGEYN